MERAQLERLGKQDLVQSFFGVQPDEVPLGSLALGKLPERFFRQVVEQHNARVLRYVNRMPDDWSEMKHRASRLRIPTFSEFQARLDNKDVRSQIAPEHRKVRDFEIYRNWVLQAQPISDHFHETFHEPRFDAFVSEGHLKRHCFVVGRSGSGKSETLKLLALKAKAPAGTIRRDRSFVLIDPHGDLARDVAGLEAFAEDRRLNPEAPDLIYLDPFLGMADGRFPTINPFDVEGKTLFQLEKIAQQLTRVFQTLVTRGDLSITLNMETLLTPCITVLLQRPGSTFFDLLRFMNDERNTDLVALGCQSPNLAHRFFFRDAFRESRFVPTKAALSTKIQSLLNTDAFARFLARPRSTVNLEKVLNEGRSVVVNCSAGRLGNQASEALGRFLVGMILGIAFSRAAHSHRSRTPIWLMIDEAQNFVSDEIKVILSEARKYGLHLTLATQVVGQDMSPQLTRVVLGNTGVKMLGNAGAESQSLMAREMHVRREYLADLQVGEFVVKSGAAPALKMRMRPDYLGQQGQMHSEAWRSMVKVQVGRYYQAMNDVPSAPNREQEADEYFEPVAPRKSRSLSPDTETSSIPDVLDQPRFSDLHPFEDLED